MQGDVRETAEYREVLAAFETLMQPGCGHVYSASEIRASRDGLTIYFTGLCVEGEIADGPSPAVYRLDRNSGVLTRIAAGARKPVLSPDDANLAFVAPHPGGAGDQLTIRSLTDETVVEVAIEGVIEQVGWSPDARRLLLVVAGLGADVSGHEGGHATAAPKAGPDWLPDVQTGREDNLWRRLWLCDAATGAAKPVTQPPHNVWEASWCGDGAIAIVRSGDHSESSWWTSTLALMDLGTGAIEELYVPTYHIGAPAGSPDGRRIAFIEAFCSDRGVICGALMDFNLTTRQAQALDTKDVDVSDLVWRDAAILHYAGHRDFETVIGDYDIAAATAHELWASVEMTTGEWYPASHPLPGGRALIAAEGYAIAPHLRLVGAGQDTLVHSFAAAGAETFMQTLGAVEMVRWMASDGLEIHGWLVRPPQAMPPYPLMLDIHGGPVWACRNRWLGRLRSALFLIRRGYAVLFPNPRGSAMRGQAFAKHVKGDMGGADAMDLLAALDHFTREGLADPDRIATTGVSYGGFMSSWLVTQDQRFAATIPISPVTDWYSQHRTSQIPLFDELFLDASAYADGNRFFSRSPVMFADRAKAPALVMVGAHDKNTPPSQALEFHRSLVEQGVETALVTYPKASHGLRDFPTYFDTIARILQWVERHVPARAVAP